MNSIKVKEFSPKDIIKKLKMLPGSKRLEVIDFLDYLVQRFKEDSNNDTERSVSAVEDTWKIIDIDRENLKYIAEDKELEYDN